MNAGRREKGSFQRHCAKHHYQRRRTIYSLRRRRREEGRFIHFYARWMVGHPENVVSFILLP